MDYYEILRLGKVLFLVFACFFFPLHCSDLDNSDEAPLMIPSSYHEPLMSLNSSTNCEVRSNTKETNISSLEDVCWHLRAQIDSNLNLNSSETAHITRVVAIESLVESLTRASTMKSKESIDFISADDAEPRTSMRMEMNCPERTSLVGLYHCYRTFFDAFLAEFYTRATITLGCEADQPSQLSSTDMKSLNDAIVQSEPAKNRDQTLCRQFQEKAFIDACQTLRLIYAAQLDQVKIDSDSNQARNGKELESLSFSQPSQAYSTSVRQLLRQNSIELDQTVPTDSRRSGAELNDPILNFRKQWMGKALETLSPDTLLCILTGLMVSIASFLGLLIFIGSQLRSRMTHVSSEELDSELC